MLAGFSRKKIKASKTLGEVFRIARRKKQISISEAEIGSKIKAKYLIALEKNDWSTLPQAVYIRGFVLSYARYLDLSAPEILSLYEAEANINKKQNTRLSYNQSIKEKKVLITSKLIAYSVLSLFIVFILGYIVYQLIGFTGAPSLKIISPQNNTVYEKDSVNLSGITDSDSLVSVNNENVPVTSDGHFALSLKLHRGVNVIKVNAKNKAKKESSEVYTIEYKPKTALTETNLNN